MDKKAKEWGDKLSDNLEKAYNQQPNIFLSVIFHLLERIIDSNSDNALESLRIRSQLNKLITKSIDAQERM